MRFRCRYCLHDAETGQRKQARPLKFEFDALHDALPTCPKCGRLSSLELVAVHFIVMADKGPFFNPDIGYSYIACQPKRDFMATSELDMFSASGEPAQTTCPACMTHPEWKARARECAKFDLVFARKIALLGIEV